MKKAIITIDTEAPVGSNPIESLIYGKVSDGKEYGIRALMSLFDEYKYKGLFFVDIAEAWDYGEKGIAEVIELIKASGHDVGVHIHPDHMADKDRRFLWQYSYDEQARIIEQCTDFYKKVVGEMPKSFRAGRYGADDDTIRIIDKLGYLYDFSEFPNNKRCRMTFDGKYNQIKTIDNTSIKEIPVSVFQSFKSPFYSRFDKIDVTQSLSEYKKVIDLFDDDQIIVFFAHSFSLLNWRRNPDRPRFSKTTYERVVRMLEYLKEYKIEVYDEQNIVWTAYGDIDDGYVSTANGLGQLYDFSRRAFTTLHDRMIRNV